MDTLIYILLLIDTIALAILTIVGIKIGVAAKSIEDFNALICDMVNDVNTNLSKIYLAHRIDFKVKYKKDLNHLNEQYEDGIVEKDTEGDNNHET